MFKRLFSFSKPDQGSLFTLHADMHCHVLPGLDDGSGDMEESLRMIEGLAKIGVRKIVCTPHVIKGMYPNSNERIQETFAQLKKAYSERYPESELQLAVAAEYMVDEFFIASLHAAAPLLINDHYILIEFPLQAIPVNYKQAIFEIQVNGYAPVLAHPERYVYARKRMRFFEELKDWGCFFQLNLLSVSGGYGAEVQKLANDLLKKGLYDFVGTDVHKQKHTDHLQRPETLRTLGHALKSHSFLNDSL